jgi:hypothetical protein
MTQRGVRWTWVLLPGHGIGGLLTETSGPQPQITVVKAVGVMMEVTTMATEELEVMVMVVMGW